uniref:Myb/SANT-like domain-containing protein n=1 Tax=Setaria italica TaxID=4555 RepID=K3ZC35_SETIT
MLTERATWNYMYEKGLVDILKELANIPTFKGQNGWTTEGWRNITNIFNDMFPTIHFTKKQVQEMEKELKGNYKIIKEARKSGVGWNNTLDMIIAEPKGWEKLIKIRITTNVKFCKKPFPLYNNLELLYEGNAFILLFITSILILPPPRRTELRPEPAPKSSELPAEPNPQTSISEQSNHSMASIGIIPLSFDLGGVESIEVQSAPASRNLEDQNVTGGKKCKQSQMAAKLRDYIDFRKDQIEKTLEKLEEKKRREEDYSIEKCIDIVDTMEELSDEQKVDANEVFQSETNRKILVGTKNPSVRLIWLKKKIVMNQ